MRPRFGATLFWAVLLTLALLPFSLSGCAPQENPPEEEPAEDAVLLGFSQLGWESAWRIGNSLDIQAAAERAGVQLMFDNAQQKQENQIKAIRSFIAYQVDVIAFAPIVEQGWDTVLQEAKDAGIPVLLTDRLIVTEDPSLYVGYVGADFLAEGRRAGEFLVEKADREGLTDLKIVELSGTPSSSPMQQRGEAFRECIAGDPRFEIVETMSGDFLRSKGKECMQEMLERHERIDVLFVPQRRHDPWRHRGHRGGGAAAGRGCDHHHRGRRTGRHRLFCRRARSTAWWSARRCWAISSWTLPRSWPRARRFPASPTRRSAPSPSSTKI